ncbi:SapC family protein [Massilia sp. MS-15]|uniref:SapC family protein n=1 Tax=Massilia sp. MS-15 TaxID=2878200 RepID=UPI001CD60F3A|nr:SapC family protein [Massilia sp. MS-15]MCA1245533.1 SapC family protein [Massilia sp. MS-15]
MANPVLLNNVEHKDLRVITRHGSDMDESHPFVPTFPAEFRLLQAHYPIIFRKETEDAPFEPIALFGFEADENLFLDEKGWDAATVPLLVDRLPFLIGRDGDELMIHIDLDSPRISKLDGEPIFLPHGGMSPYLESVNQMLVTVHHGMGSNAAFVAALVQNELIESFSLDVTLDDGSQNRLAGFYTINEEKLEALDGAVVAELHKAGYLAPIYYQLASLSNFRALIDRKNARRAARS